MNQHTSYFPLKTKDTDFKEKIKGKLNKQHYMHFVGVEMTKIEEGYSEATLEVKEHHLQQMGFLHGGVTALMADLVTGFAAYSLVAKDEAVVTADLKISYFLPGDGEKILAKGWVTKPGNMLHFCEGEIWNYKGNNEPTLIAKVSAIMAVVKNMEKK